MSNDEREAEDDMTREVGLRASDDTELSSKSPWLVEKKKTENESLWTTSLDLVPVSFYVLQSAAIARWLIPNESTALSGDVFVPKDETSIPACRETTICPSERLRTERR